MVVCVVVSLLIYIVVNDNRQREEEDRKNQKRIDDLVTKVESAERSAKEMIDVLNRGYEGK